MSTMFEAVTITPELAEGLLAMNTENRRLRPSHVAYLARAIERGEWQMPPDAIMVSDSGKLLNGQHRLTAVVRSGKPVRLHVKGTSRTLHGCTGSHMSRSKSSLAFASLGFPVRKELCGCRMAPCCLLVTH